MPRGVRVGEAVGQASRRIAGAGQDPHVQQPGMAALLCLRRRSGLNPVHQPLNTGFEGLAIRERVIVVALEVHQPLRLVGGGKVLLCMLVADQAVLPAVHDHHGRLDGRQFLAGVILDRAEPPHRQPPEQLRAHIRDAGERALQHHPPKGPAPSQFGSNAAPQRFAECNDVGGGEPPVRQPVQRRFRIPVGPLLAGSAFALSVTAVVEGEHRRARLQQGFINRQPVTDVPAVAMTKQDGGAVAAGVDLGREKPAVQHQSVRGFEPDLLVGPTQLLCARIEVARWMVDIRLFEPAEKHHKQQQQSQHNGQTPEPGLGACGHDRILDPARVHGELLEEKGCCAAEPAAGWRGMAESVSRPRLWSTCLWGNTVALSWMWGLGLFFTVQFTSQFGLFGLLTFSIPNALGLMVFGLVTQRIAQRSGGPDSLANFFSRWSRPFRLVFLLYQILAIALTIFAIIHYLWQPLGLEPRVLFLPLTLLIVLAAAILFGEEFNIQRIRFSHGVLFLLALAAMGVLLFGRRDLVDVSALRVEKHPTNDWNYWGYAVPICIGFLVGPWLDLQQWQRAIQMHRERISIRWAYVAGSLEFFALLLFHGGLTLWAREAGAAAHIREGLSGYTYAQDMLVRFFFQQAAAHPWIFAAYCVFLCVCILTTLDSGYIALRWFQQSYARTSNHPIFSLVPQRLVTSPIPLMVLCGLVGLAGSVAGLEIEYFMIFYATFFVGYSTLGIARCFTISPANLIPQVKMFSIGSLAVVIFAYGYFLRHPLLQIVGSLLPLGYVAWLLLKPGAAAEFVADADELESTAESSLASHQPLPVRAEGEGVALTPATTVTGSAVTALPATHGVHDLSGHFEGKWFVHQFISTYADTNSVGNVYFGMYAMWVGKTRELFFNKVMPKFDLQTTPFYILTRSFEHKFLRETREFESVSVRIRIGNYNRKFVTLEHEVYDSKQQMLGKGKQSLLFVSSADYRMIDIPPEVYSAFVVHA